MRSASLGSVLLLLVMSLCAACGDTAPEPRQAAPWAPGSGPQTRISGSVTTPDGAPISGARVELIYGGDPHYPEALAYTTQSGPEGRFVFEGLSAYSDFDIVVRHAGAERTFSPSSPSGPEVRDRASVEIRFAPTRTLPLSVRCREAPQHPRLTSDVSSMEVDVRWLPVVQDILVRTTMPATDGTPDPLSGRGEPAMSRLRPGRSLTLPRIPRDARAFAAELELPIGRQLITISGPCGVVTQEVEVPPGTGAMDPVELVLPAVDHSELVVMLGRDSRRSRVLPEIFVGATRLRHRYDLNQGSPIRIHRVAPGTYHVRGVTCHQPIEVPPGTVTSVTIGPGRCDIRSRPR